MYAVMITAHNALSIRRRGSSNSGKKLPVRSFGMPISTSPAGVDKQLRPVPVPQRRTVRRSFAGCGTADVSSASISS